MSHATGASRRSGERERVGESEGQSPSDEPSGAPPLNRDQIAERGARMARRDDREYLAYLREEQRRQPGCPAREVVLIQRRHATSSPWLKPVFVRP